MVSVEEAPTEIASRATRAITILVQVHRRAGSPAIGSSVKVLAPVLHHRHYPCSPRECDSLNFDVVVHPFGSRLIAQEGYYVQILDQDVVGINERI